MQKLPRTKATCLSSLILSLAILASGCSFPGVYRINVQQGNIVTQDMLDKLKPGMTKNQVHFALGNPVVKNLFNESQDTYLYTYQAAGGETTAQRLTMHYENGLFVRYDGELLEEHLAY